MMQYCLLLISGFSFVTSIDYHNVERGRLVDVDLFYNYLYIKSNGTDDIDITLYEDNRRVGSFGFTYGFPPHSSQKAWILNIENCYIEGGMTMWEVPAVTEKIWRVDFNPARVLVQCNGVKVNSFSYADVSPWDDPYAECVRAMEDVPLTRIQFDMTDKGSRMYGIVDKKEEETKNWKEPMDNHPYLFNVYRNDLYMRTYVAQGRQEMITIGFSGSSGPVTEFTVRFTDWKFFLTHCTPSKNILVNVPNGNDKIWKIDYRREYFRVEINGVIVTHIAFSLQGESCVSAVKGRKITKVSFEGPVHSFAKVKKV